MDAAWELEQILPFLHPDRRARAAATVRRPDKWQQFLHRTLQDGVFDPALLVEPLPGEAPAALADRLRGRGARDTAELLSWLTDSATLPLGEAVEWLTPRTDGFLVARPGSLAVYQSEYGERTLLSRP